MNRFRLAVFIGRFQPFHNGHLYSFTKCFEIAERVIVGVGSSNISGTENNPWDYATRKKMIDRVLLEIPTLRGVSSQVEIVPVPDTESDEEWVGGVEDLLKKTGIRKQEIVIVSNNEWVTRLMKQAGYTIYETGLYNRDELEGVKIRALMRAGDDSWKSRVPESVALQIDMVAI